MSSGLLDIYYDGLDRLKKWSKDSQHDDFSGMQSDMNQDGSGWATSLRNRKSPTWKKDGNIFPKSIVPPGQGTINFGDTSVKVLPDSVMDKENIKKSGINPDGIFPPGSPWLSTKKSVNESTALVNKDGTTLNKNEIGKKELGFFSKLAGLDFKTISKQFKEGGGFEALMANPAFTLGLAMMQSSAQGKRIDESILNNFVKAAGLSDHYADRLRARSAVVGMPNADERQLVEDIMEANGLSRQWAIRNIWPGGEKQNTDANWREIQETIYKKTMERLKKNAGSGKEVSLTRDEIKKTVNQLIGDKTLTVKKKWFDFLPFIGRNEVVKTGGTQINYARGGTAKKGQTMIVGEEGPEIVTAKENLTVHSNDDSQIIAMLLASNPQLQKVSRTRAIKILKARFPEYFE